MESPSSFGLRALTIEHIKWMFACALAIACIHIFCRETNDDDVVFFVLSLSLVPFSPFSFGCGKFNVFFFHIFIAHIKHFHFMWIKNDTLCPNTDWNDVNFTDKHTHNRNRSHTVTQKRSRWWPTRRRFSKRFLCIFSWLSQARYAVRVHFYRSILLEFNVVLCLFLCGILLRQWANKTDKRNAVAEISACVMCMCVDLSIDYYYYCVFCIVYSRYGVAVSLYRCIACLGSRKGLDVRHLGNIRECTVN